MSNTTIDTTRTNQYRVTQQPETPDDEKQPYKTTTTEVNRTLKSSRPPQHSSTPGNIANFCNTLAACCCCLCILVGCGSCCDSDSDGGDGCCGDDCCDCDGCDC